MNIHKIIGKGLISTPRYINHTRCIYETHDNNYCNIACATYKVLPWGLVTMVMTMSCSYVFAGECFLPTIISNLELVRRDSGGNTSNFNIVLRCRDGFSPIDDRMTVCCNSTWIPDLDEIECHNI